MSLYNDWYLTTMLKEAQQAAATSGNVLTFKRMIATSDVISTNDFVGLTNDILSTITIKQESKVSSTSIKGSTATIIAVFTNANVSEDYLMNTVLLTAEYNGQEFLAAITGAKTPYLMPVRTATEQTEYTFKVQIGISNSAVINLSMDPNAVVVQEQLDAVKDEAKIGREQLAQDVEALKVADGQSLKQTGDQTATGKLTLTQPLNADVAGNAKTATQLLLPKSIDTVPFDGTKDIFTNNVYRGTITGSNDLRSYVQAGAYIVNSVMNVNNPRGGESITGHLVVYSTSGSNLNRSWAHMIFWSSTGELYACDAGVMGKWIQYPDLKTLYETVQIENLVPNSAFTDKGKGWYGYQNKNANFSDKMPVTDDYIVDSIIYHKDKTDTDKDYYDLRSPLINLRGRSKTLNVSVLIDLKNLPSDTSLQHAGKVQFEFLDEQFKYLSNVDVVVITRTTQQNDWHRISGDVIVPSGAQYGVFKFIDYKDGLIYWTQPQVTEGSGLKPFYLSGTGTVDNLKDFAVDNVLSFVSLPDGVDLNSIKEPGNYKLHGISVVNGPSEVDKPNYPIWGVLSVYSDRNNAWTNQTLVRNIEAGTPSQIWRRELGTYNKQWHRIAIDSEVLHKTGGESKSGEMEFKDRVALRGALEIYSSTPYVDFHYQNSIADFTTRLIELEKGHLSLVDGPEYKVGVLHANLAGNATTATRLAAPFKINNVPTDGSNSVFADNVYRAPLTGNVDLNNITKPGVYSVRNVTNANNPFGGKAINGDLEVRAVDDSDNRSWTHQTFFQDSGDVWFNDTGATGAPNWKRSKNAADTLTDIQNIMQWDNLIPNSDFDGGTYGWDLGNDNVTSQVAVEGLNITPAGPDASQFRAAIMNTAKPSSTANWGGATSNRIRLRPGSKYFYSAWVYTDGLNGATPPLGQIGLNFYRLDGSLIDSPYERFDFINSPVADHYNKWHRLAKFFVAPANAAYARFIFFSRQGTREYMAMPMLCDMLNREVEPWRYVKGENPFDKMLSFFDISTGANNAVHSTNSFDGHNSFNGPTWLNGQTFFNNGVEVTKGDINVAGKVNPTALEITSNTPYIDFHSGSDTSNDFTTRIIEQEKGKLSLFQGVPFGKGTLIANLEGNASTASKLSGQIHKGTFTLSGLMINYLWGNGTVTLSLFATPSVNLDGSKNLGKIPSGIPIPETTVTAAGFLAGINIFHFNVNQYGDFYTDFFGDTTNKYVRGSLSYPYDMMKYS